MYILNELYDLGNSGGVQAIKNAIDNILEVIRWVVPIGLLVMTGVDIAKKVINPDEKEGQKKIMHRLVAAIIVFLVPTIVKIVESLVEIGKNGMN